MTSLSARRRALLAVVWLLTVAAPATGQWRAFESEFDEDKKPWKEIEAKLPPPPRAENLIPFEAVGGLPHRYYVDAPSISVGEDGIVRYTLVVKTAGGATNVSFDGIRCENREHKQYAVGRADGSWVRARDPQWRSVEGLEQTRQHNVLYRDFFCPERHARLTTVKQILEALRQSRGNLR